MAQEKKVVIEDDSEEMPYDAAPGTAVGDPAADEPAPAGDPVKALEDALDQAQADARENKDRMLRMAAELENFKKRAARERDDLRKFATENLIRQLLTVVDNLERAIESANAENANVQSVVDGVSLTRSEVMKILEQQHVVPINALGESFDPAFHQAMCQEPCSDAPPNTVIKEFQKGYLIHDRLLRPAMVVVSTTGACGAPDEKIVDTNA